MIYNITNLINYFVCLLIIYWFQSFLEKNYVWSVGITWATGGCHAVAAVDNPTNSTFKITDTKLYVPVVTLLTEDDPNFLEKSKSGFKRTITWNK